MKLLLILSLIVFAYLTIAPGVVRLEEQTVRLSKLLSKRSVK